MNPDDTANALNRILTLLDDHERRLNPVGPDGLPRPTGRINGGLVGYRWDVRDWVVFCPDTEPDRDGCIYIHTPESLREGDESLDVTAVPYRDARELATAILAALTMAEADAVLPQPTNRERTR